MNEEYYRSYYDRMGKEAYLGSKLEDSSRMRQVRDWIQKYVMPGGKILDIACGDAVYAKLNPEYEWHGVDINTSKAQDKKISLKEHNLDLTPYPYDSGSFDCITNSEFLEHIWDPVKVHKEARRMLKREGTYIVTTPNHTAFMNLLQGFENLVYDPDLSWRIEHIRTYTVGAHKKCLSLAGFAVEEICGADGHYDPFVNTQAEGVVRGLKTLGIEVPVSQIHQFMGQGLPEMQHTIMLACKKV